MNTVACPANPTSTIIIHGVSAADIAKMGKERGWIKDPEPVVLGRTPEEIEESKVQRKRYRRIWVARDRAEELKQIITRRREFFRRIRRNLESQIARDNCQAAKL